MVLTHSSDQRDLWRCDLAGRCSLAVCQNKVHGWGETIQISTHRKVYCKESDCMHVLSLYMAEGAYYKLRQTEYLLFLHRLMMLTWLCRAISGISKKTTTTLKIARENELSRSFKSNSGRKTSSRYGIIWKGFLTLMPPLPFQKEDTFLAVNSPPKNQYSYANAVINAS